MARRPGGVARFLRGLPAAPNGPAPGRVYVAAARRYPAPAEYGSPAGGFVRSVAHDLKHARPAAVRAAAAEMAPIAAAVARASPRPPVLAPVPGSGGSTRANLALAEAVGRLAGLAVVDGLDRAPTASQYALRKAGLPGLAPGEMPARWDGPRPAGPVILVDNVVTSGATAEAARRAVGGDVFLLVWADAG